MHFIKHIIRHKNNTVQKPATAMTTIISIGATHNTSGTIVLYYYMYCVFSLMYNNGQGGTSPQWLFAVCIRYCNSLVCLYKQAVPLKKRHISRLRFPVIARFLQTPRCQGSGFRLLHNGIHEKNIHFITITDGRGGVGFLHVSLIYTKSGNTSGVSISVVS